MRSTLFENNQIRFMVWAPLKEKMILHILTPVENHIAMTRDEKGYFSAEVPYDNQEILYFYRPEDAEDFPDPASQYQPHGVHGPSQVVDHSTFEWTDQDWKGIPLQDYIIYELHVGCFTPEGSFEAIINRLDELKETGINAIELMPVAQFPGKRNWGYDGVCPYAVQDSYGGPEGLKKLVDACHQKGIAVILDVVYNHLGPEGNYLPQFGPYNTSKYQTPWGDAINFDGEYCDGVREYFADNILFWKEVYHIDALRLDAIHSMYDNGAVHFWELVQQLLESSSNRKPFYLVAESDLNSPKVVEQTQAGGYGFNAQWLDDFHHALYVKLNPEDRERYYDFGSMAQLAKAYKEGFVHSGEWVKFRKRRHGRSSAGISGDKFIAFNLNHDQAGNRAGGERLCMLVNTERVMIAAAALMMSPYIPMLFMGEEYGDESPFFYFVNHTDKDLIEAVREGRIKEFRDYGFEGELTDPQAEETFLSCKLKWENRKVKHHGRLLEWHRQLIHLRKNIPALKEFSKELTDAVVIHEDALAVYRYERQARNGLICFLNFSQEEISCSESVAGQVCEKILDSKEKQWMGIKTGSNKTHPDQLEPGKPFQLLPESAVIYEFRNK